MQAEKKHIIKLLNITKGQIEGIIRMIEDDKYCIEISNQVLASIAILKKANIEILDAHLNNCVVNASSPLERKEKMEEVSMILKKVAK